MRNCKRGDKPIPVHQFAPIKVINATAKYPNSYPRVLAACVCEWKHSTAYYFGHKFLASAFEVYLRNHMDKSLSEAISIANFQFGDLLAEDYHHYVSILDIANEKL